MARSETKDYNDSLDSVPESSGYNSSNHAGRTQNEEDLDDFHVYSRYMVELARDKSGDAEKKKTEENVQSHLKSNIFHCLV